ncbi:phage antirepressor KilAC domain-containing protein [Serratia entomophila]|uniref:phage antirepressor KilAC domain-containing protein n=1 Tax=Serratia entomophila TaxID=42906 RepID=UPI00217A9A0E|nr:phage antirepressor KilAC domain-containing protein [Serratia entomophila]CAI1745745.1 Uncharacterized phage-encoded protein [Serratia entomophila]
MANVAICGNSLKMTSREIAELTDKRHFDVMRDIERMFEQLGENVHGCAQNFVHPQNGQNYREYALDREHTECLVTGYSASLRMRVIKRLHELEEQNSLVPQTLPEALRLAADMAEQKAQLEQKVQADAPKVAFVDHYVDASGSKSLRATAKVLNMPEKAMIDALIRDKVLFRQSGNLLPYASHHHSGNFTVKTGTAEQSGHAFTQTRVTPRGIQWIAERYASELMAS